MEAFVSLSATAAPIDIPNCDTDQIIPARFLRHLHTDGGYDRYLFHDLRFDDTGGEREGFVLNQAAFRSAEIIVADVNWGCGSSRENAVDALLAFGIRCVIAPSFGDIHYNNCINRGVLPIRLPRETCDQLRAKLHSSPGSEISISLEAQSIDDADGQRYTFEIAEFDKFRLLRGLDDVGLTLEYEGAIEQFEVRHSEHYDWL